MFDVLLEMFNSSTAPSDASRLTMRAVARDEALTEVIRQNPSLGSSPAGLTSGLNGVKIEGIADPIINLSNPYPKFGQYRQDVSASNELNNDRDMIRNLESGRTDILKPAMAWLAGFSKRDEIKSRMEPGDDSKLTKVGTALLKAGFRGNSSDVQQVFSDECKPILQRLIPEAFESARTVLKKTVAKHFFHGIRDEANIEDHIALSTMSSNQLIANMIDRLIKRDTKVILPIPYFDPFPLFLDRVGANVITTDTTKTGYKLQAEDLRKLIEKNDIKKGDWLFLTSPDNATMNPYTKDELQAIANVVAEKGLNVICDELYARLSKEPHVSLASLEAYGPEGLVQMRDRVITTSGCSKQFPFGSDVSRKLGVALFPNSDDAKLIEERIKVGDTEVGDQIADVYRGLIETTPGRIRTESYKNTIHDGEQVIQMIDELNEKYGSSGEKPFELISSGGYLACLKMNERWDKESGIHTGEDLAGYLLAATGLFTKSMVAEGVTDPVVRFNVNQCAEHIEEVQLRLDSMLEAIAEKKAPTMDKVRRSVDKLVEHAPQMTSQVTTDQVRHATQRM